MPSKPLYMQLEEWQEKYWTLNRCHGYVKEELAEAKATLETQRAALAAAQEALQFYMAGHPCTATNECPSKNKAIAALATAPAGVGEGVCGECGGTGWVLRVDFRVRYERCPNGCEVKGSPFEATAPASVGERTEAANVMPMPRCGCGEMEYCDQCIAEAEAEAATQPAEEE